MNSAQNECVAGLQRRTISGIGAGEPTSKNAGLVPGGTACQFGFEWFGERCNVVGMCRGRVYNRKNKYLLNTTKSYLNHLFCVEKSRVMYYNII